MGILLTGKQESLWSFLIVPSPLAKLYITFDLLHSFNLSIASAANLRKSAGTRTLTLKPAKARKLANLRVH